MEHTYTCAHLATRIRFIPQTTKKYTGCTSVWFVCVQTQEPLFILRLNVRQISTRTQEKFHCASLSVCRSQMEIRHETYSSRVQLEDKVTNGMVTLPLHSPTHLHTPLTHILAHVFNGVDSFYQYYLLNDRLGRVCVCIGVNISKEQLQLGCDLFFFSFLLSVNIQTNNNG